MIKIEAREPDREILSINQILGYLKQSAELFFSDMPIDFSSICQWLESVKNEDASLLSRRTCLFTLHHRIDALFPQLILKKNGGYLFLQVKTDAGRVLVNYGYGQIDNHPETGILYSFLDEQNIQEDCSNNEFLTELLKFHIAKLLPSPELAKALEEHLLSMMEEIDQGKLDAEKWLGELMTIKEEFIPNLQEQQKERMNFDKIVGILSKMI